jgi:hypothetical protein
VSYDMSYHTSYDMSYDSVYSSVVRRVATQWKYKFRLRFLKKTSPKSHPNCVGSRAMRKMGSRAARARTKKNIMALLMILSKILKILLTRDLKMISPAKNFCAREKIVRGDPYDFFSRALVRNFGGVFVHVCLHIIHFM